LKFSIAPRPETVHAVLLQKRSAVFSLAVWNDRPTGGEDTVTVDLVEARSSVRIYDPTVGTEPVQKFESVRSVQLTLTDHPVVLEFDPREASGPDP
jgi:hypothetical protein